MISNLSGKKDEINVYLRIILLCNKYICWYLKYNIIVIFESVYWYHYVKKDGGMESSKSTILKKGMEYGFYHRFRWKNKIYSEATHQSINDIISIDLGELLSKTFWLETFLVKFKV